MSLETAVFYLGLCAVWSTLSLGCAIFMAAEHVAKAVKAAKEASA